MNTPPKCEHCGAPALNVNGRGDYIGHHSSIEECLQKMQLRVASLEKAFERAEHAARRRP